MGQVMVLTCCTFRVFLCRFDKDGIMDEYTELWTCRGILCMCVSVRDKEVDPGCAGQITLTDASAAIMTHNRISS